MRKAGEAAKLALYQQRRARLPKLETLWVVFVEYVLLTEAEL